MSTFSSIERCENCQIEECDNTLDWFVLTDMADAKLYELARGVGFDSNIVLDERAETTVQNSFSRKAAEVIDTFKIGWYGQGCVKNGSEIIDMIAQAINLKRMEK